MVVPYKIDLIDCKGWRIGNTSLNNNEVGRFVLLDIKNYSLTIIKIIRY